MRVILAAVLLAASSAPSLALTLDDYPEYRAVWSLNCQDPNADRVDVETESVTITLAGTSHVYRGVELNKVFAGGAHADGKKAWILGSKEPKGDYAFSAEVPGRGRKGPLELHGESDSEGLELKPLWGKKFQKCPAR